MKKDDVAICILSAAGRYTLPDTFRSLPGLENYPNISVTWIGTNPPPYIGPARTMWSWLSREPLGHVADYFAHLDMSLAVFPKAKRFILLEDDVAATHGALDVMAEIPIPARVGFYTFCNIVGMSPLRGSEPVGVEARPLYFYGTQAIVMDRTKLHDAARWRWAPEAHPQAGDVQLGRWARSRGHSIAYYAPSLIQHTGAQSLANPANTLTGGRIALYWPGPCYDALSHYRESFTFLSS